MCAVYNLSDKQINFSEETWLSSIKRTKTKVKTDRGSYNIEDQERVLTKYRAEKDATVTRINGQNAKKNVPPSVSSSLARGINP